MPVPELWPLFLQLRILPQHRLLRRCCTFEMEISAKTSYSCRCLTVAHRLRLKNHTRIATLHRFGPDRTTSRAFLALLTDVLCGPVWAIIRHRRRHLPMLKVD